MEETKIIAYKGFDENLCCKGFQYEVGKEYEQEGEIVCCLKGFHACLNPFDVLEFYEINGKNRYCIVEQSGIIKPNRLSTNQASSKIKIIAEIGMDGLFKDGIEWIKEMTNPYTIIKAEEEKGHVENGDDAHIASSGLYAKISSIGDNAQIGSSGRYAHIGTSGDDTQIGTSGHDAHICSSGDDDNIGSRGVDAWIGSSGEEAKIGSSGDKAQIASSGDTVRIGSIGNAARISSSGFHAHIGSCGDDDNICSSGYKARIFSIGNKAQIGSSGEFARIVSSGCYAKIASSGGYSKIESAGEYSVICCADDNSMAKAKKGSWITLSEWKYIEEKDREIPVCVKTEFVDGVRIKEDTWYKLIDGEFKEQ